MKNLLNKILMKFNYKLINITKTTEYINKYTKELEEQIINLKTTHLTEVEDLKLQCEQERQQLYECMYGDIDDDNHWDLMKK